MILESDTIKGVCKGCGFDFPMVWGVAFETQLNEHDCPNQEKLQKTRLERVITMIESTQQKVDDIAQKLQIALDKLDRLISDVSGDQFQDWDD